MKLVQVTVYALDSFVEGDNIPLRFLRFILQKKKKYNLHSNETLSGLGIMGSAGVRTGLRAFDELTVRNENGERGKEKGV
ncbi:hypothetical protein SK128_027410 [Halocaridina rubra]|uniref:Uncharacterized protein n=1 Tax=Halocaridina rubra TaxID=373956 RepID=A0AAN9A8B8_HALRR